MGGLIIGLVVAVLLIASVWIVFTKAGQAGWACIIPIYNLVVLMRIANKPLWWVILCLIPLVNIVIIIMTYIAVAKNFGKGVGFGLGLTFLSFIFFPILAFGDTKYVGGQ